MVLSLDTFVDVVTPTDPVELAPSGTDYNGLVNKVEALVGIDMRTNTPCTLSNENPVQDMADGDPALPLTVNGYAPDVDVPGGRHMVPYRAALPDNTAIPAGDYAWTVVFTITAKQ